MRSTRQGCGEEGEGEEGLEENSSTMRFKRGREPAEKAKKEGSDDRGSDYCPELCRQARTGKGMSALSAGKTRVTLSMLSRSLMRNKVSHLRSVCVDSCSNCGCVGEDRGSAIAWGVCGLGWGYFAVEVDEELVERKAPSVLPFFVTFTALLCILFLLLSFYVHFCLKTLYFTYMVDSLTLNSVTNRTVSLA